MPFDANGNYSLPTIYLAIPGETIKSTQHNTPLEDVQSALNNTLCRDGRTPWTGSQNANNNKLTGLAKGTNSTDAVRMDQVATLDGEADFTGKVTVQDVDDWTTNEPVPAKQADGRYLQRCAAENSATDFTPYYIGIQRSTRHIWLYYKDDNGVAWDAFAQPAGDYATNPALNTEITNRTNADTDLQNQINNRVQKTGDTIDWLTITGGSVTTIGYSGNDGVSGGIAYAEGLTSVKQSGDTPLAIYRFINQNGVGPFATIWLTDNQGNEHELRFGADDRLRTASGNVFALTSELPFTDQNLRVQVFSAIATDGVFVNLPIAFRTLVGVTAQQHSSGGEGIRPIRIETNVFQGNGFNVSIWSGGGGIQYTFVAYGYF